MKRSVTSILLLLVTLFTAQAQRDLGIEISANSGLALPVSPMTFSHYWNMQYGGGLRIGIPISESMTVLGAAEYYKFTLNKNGLNEDYNIQYLKDIWIFKNVTMDALADPSSVTTFSANLRIAPVKESQILMPYFIAGVGAMHVSLSEIDLMTTSVISLDSSDVNMVADQYVVGGSGTSFFFQLGLGIDAKLTQILDVFIEGRYAAGLNRVWGTAYIPLTAGVKLQL